MAGDGLERLPRRTRAALVLGAGLFTTTLVLMDFTHGKAGAVLVMMTPVCLLLGVAGLIDQELVGKDHELTPAGRRKQIGVIVVGMLLGFGLVALRGF